MQLLQAATAEGVVTLVAERLQGLPERDPSRMAFMQAARPVAALALLRQAQAQRVVDLLASAGIHALLLKGGALARWLYPAPHLRECADLDLLLPSAEETERATRWLGKHGFSGGYYFGEESHEVTCRSTQPGLPHVELDLHWRLFNAPLFAAVFPFRELEAAAIPIPGLGPNARGLSPVHAFIHAAVHRAKNLHYGPGDRLKWLYDLHLLIQHLSDDDWTLLLRLCRQHGVGGICLDSIEQASRVLHSEAPAWVLSDLAAMQAGEDLDVRRLGDWRYMQWMNFRALPTASARIRWLWRRAFPPMDYLREFYGDMGGGALMRERMRRLSGRLR